MVTVAPFMVHPRLRAAKQLTLALVWASGALIVPRPGKKFGWAVFGEIVKEPLKTDPCAEAMRDHAVAVPRNGHKMTDGMCHIMRDPLPA